MNSLIELKPIYESQSDWDDLEEELKRLFREELYLPLLKELGEPKRVLKNSIDDLIDAMRSGRLTYNKGKFSGKLNATLSKELKKLGATWDKRLQCFSLPVQNLPIEIKAVIGTSEARFLDKMSKLDKKISAVVPDQLADKLKASKIFDRAIFKVEKEFRQSVRNITVPAEMSETTRTRIAEEWQNNMRKYVSDFTQEEIKNLRSQIRENVLKGNRYEAMVDTIRKSYDVSKNKAKFLARQETNLMMTAYKEGRYKDVGVKYYKWKSVMGSKLHPVRPRHKELNDASANGKLFDFDHPPVTSEAGQPERRNNPGQDYNCRCRAIPIFAK